MSDEYISREEMIDAVDHLHIIPSIDGTGKPTPTEDFRVQFIGTVLHVPSADVVPVVRCKDCKHDISSQFDTAARCNLWGCLKPKRGFCDAGKRREE